MYVGEYEKALAETKEGLRPIPPPTSPSLLHLRSKLNGVLAPRLRRDVLQDGIVFQHGSRKASGLCQLDPPYRPSLVERAFGFDEGRGLTAENPHMSVWRLLPC